MVPSHSLMLIERKRRRNFKKMNEWLKKEERIFGTRHPVILNEQPMSHQGARRVRKNVLSPLHSEMELASAQRTQFLNQSGNRWCSFVLLACKKDHKHISATGGRLPKKTSNEPVSANEIPEHYLWVILSCGRECGYILRGGWLDFLESRYLSDKRTGAHYTREKKHNKIRMRRSHDEMHI